MAVKSGATPSSLFPTTDWAALRRQPQDQWTEVQEDAMAHLFQAYARPLQVFLQQRGRNEHDAEEQVQGFFAFAVSRGILREVESRETRFRSFLLAVFLHWLTDQQRREAAAKRGGNVPHRPLDARTTTGQEIMDEGSDLAACQSFDREWAWAVVGRALARLRTAYEKRGRQALFEALSGILPGGGGTVLPYAEIATALGMTEPAVRRAAHDLRRSCAEFLRAEVGRTVAEAGQVDEELRYLLQLLRQEHGH